MKITRIRLNSLRNEEWFSFFTDFKKFVEEYKADVLGIQELFAVFLLLYADADIALEKISKSALTDRIAQADDRRDRTFRGLSDIVKGYRNHFKEDKRDAANRIQVVFDHYGNMAERPYNEETSALYNFMQELTGKYTADIQLLDLQDWLTELNTNNSDFDALMMQRNKEEAFQTDLHVANIRTKLDRNYLDMIERIEALMTVNGNSDYLDFVKVLNTNVDYYATTLAQRQGRNAAKKNDTTDTGE